MKIVKIGQVIKKIKRVLFKTHPVYLSMLMHLTLMHSLVNAFYVNPIVPIIPYDVSIIDVYMILLKCENCSHLYFIIFVHIHVYLSMLMYI